MSLTSRIFGEEYVTRQERLTRTVTKFDIDAPGKGNDPTPLRRVMVVADMGSKIVSEQQSRGRASGSEDGLFMREISRGDHRIGDDAYQGSRGSVFVRERVDFDQELRP